MSRGPGGRHDGRGRPGEAPAWARGRQARAASAREGLRARRRRSAMASSAARGSTAHATGREAPGSASGRREAHAPWPPNLDLSMQFIQSPARTSDGCDPFREWWVAEGQGGAGACAPQSVATQALHTPHAAQRLPLGAFGIVSTRGRESASSLGVRQPLPGTCSDACDDDGAPHGEMWSPVSEKRHYMDGRPCEPTGCAGWGRWRGTFAGFGVPADGGGRGRTAGCKNP